MRAVLALAGLMALGACSRGSTVPTASVEARGVAYVRMDELVRAHPLYAQLVRVDANIQALDIEGFVPRVFTVDADQQAQETALEHAIAAAERRAQEQLATQNQRDLQAEHAQIVAALNAAGNVPGVAAVVAQMETTARGQVADIAAAAQADLAAYRHELDEADRHEEAAINAALVGRAQRAYQAKVDEYSGKEAALSLSLAKADAFERLSFRTKLASLALDDAARGSVNAQLEALDRKEADQIGALHNLDQQLLSTEQATLRAGVASQLQAQVADIRARSLARYQARVSQVRSQFAVPTGSVLGANDEGATLAGDPRLPAQLRAKILQIHDQTRARTQAAAARTLADFHQAEVELRARRTTLAHLTTEANQSDRVALEGLKKQRAQLYDRMVQQIARQVDEIARARNLSFVASDVAAPASAIDLTPAAKREIETLHE